MHKGQDGATGFRAASGRLKRKSAVRQNGAITTGKMAGPTGLMDALRAPLPLRLKPSGEFLKTAHWAVFSTEFHLIGSSPAPCSKTKTAGAIASAVKFLGADNGARTRDPHLGKVVLYQLSHVRKYGGENRIRTGGEGFAGPCLTTWPSRHYQKKPARKRASNELERTTGLEPATTLARWCSTTEPCPRSGGRYKI